MKTITIHTDGAARGNPGSAGIGAVIASETGEQLAEISEYIGETTNNYAEYEAVIRALETLKKQVGTKERADLSVTIKLDSELVTKQLNDEYQIKEETLFPQFIRVHNLRVKYFPRIDFVHVPREENKEADSLANRAIDSAHV